MGVEDRSMGRLAALVWTGREAFAGWGRHASSQLAAAISYRVLFSLVPFVALLVSALELVLPEHARHAVMSWLFRGEGSHVESAVSKTVVHPGATASLGGIVAVAGLLWAATGMMSSIRTALAVIWEERRPPYARGKVRDLLLVGLAALLILLGFAVSIVVRLVAEVGRNLSDTVGLQGDAHVVGTLSQLGGSTALGFVAFAVVYRVATPVHLRFRDVWPSALLAAVAVEALSAGFAYYLSHISDLSAIYGSAGAIFAFLLLVYLLAAILLLGAEVAAARAALEHERG
jgi:membrane protein